MPRTLIAASLLLLTLCGTALKAQTLDGEAALRESLATALWPGDIVRLADQYRQRYPDGPAAASATLWRERAAESQRVLSRNDVRLHRAAFSPASADASDPTVSDLRQAALGDREAAVRLARQYQHAKRAGADGDAMANRYVGWLQYASQLGSERASYELALHFRRDAQPVLASKYENLALALGYQPPVALDNIRK